MLQNPHQYWLSGRQPLHYPDNAATGSIYRSPTLEFTGLRGLSRRSGAMMGSTD